MSARQLPLIAQTRTFHTLPILDHQLHDPLNLDLPETAVSALSAVLVAFSMLLLADLVYRVAVRARVSHPNSFAVHRGFLLSRLTNPISFATLILTSLRRRPSSPSTKRPPDAPTPAFPTSQTAIIATLAALLAVSDLLFLFLSTSTTSSVPVDTTSFASLALRDDGAHLGLNLSVYRRDSCEASALSTRPRLQLLAHSLSCVFSILRRNNRTMPPHTAVVILDVHPIALTVVVRTVGAVRIFGFQQRIKLANLTEYAIIPDVSPQHAKRVIPKLFARYGFDVNMMPIHRTKNRFGHPRWEIGIRIMQGQLVLPENDVSAAKEYHAGTRKEIPEADVQSLALSFYVANVTTSLLRLEGRSGAVQNDFVNHGWPMDDYRQPLVLRQQARLNLVGNMGVCAGLFVAWMAVAGLVHWRPSVEHRVAWAMLFPDMREPADLERLQDQVLALHPRSPACVSTGRSSSDTEFIKM